MTQSLVPSATVLPGLQTRQVLTISGNTASGDQRLQNLTIRGGFSALAGAGLRIGGNAGFDGAVSVTRVVFERNTGSNVGAGMLLSTAGLVTVSNNMFLANECSSDHCAFSATVNAASNVSIRAFFGNNTIVSNGCAPGLCSVSNGGARIAGSARSLFYNNLFAENTGTDIQVGVATELRNNNYVSVQGTPALLNNNLSFANPQFVNLLDDDLRLLSSSPMRNAGSNAFALRNFDLSGLSRINWFIVDIGAYANQDQLFTDGFEFLQ